MSSSLTASQLQALVATERVNSAISIVGIIFVVTTYLFCPGFNKPINRLIFFASFGNLGSNIAALISEIGPRYGARTPICNFQAFLVQMFLGVDCYWAFCMALNVYLVFFRGFTVEKLRSLDPFYLLACYGLSFIPAFVFLFISTRDRGPMYGPAIIWCWITVEWDFMRMLFLYAIVWVAIVLALVIYGCAAKVIWDKREHLDGFLNPLNENPFVNTITTEVEITTEERPIIDKETNGSSGIEEGLNPAVDAGIENLYSVNIHVEPGRHAARPMPAALRMRSITREIAQNETNAEAWLYARVAFLFFIALLITWVPSSVNRVYALVKPNAVNFGLNYAASFVFPLQAFWNAIVYIITSQGACKELWQVIILRKSLRDAKAAVSASVSGQSLPSPSGSQVKLTRRAQQDPMGKPQRLRSMEQVHTTESGSPSGEEQEMQDFGSSRWSTDSHHQGLSRGRTRNR